MNNRCKKQGCEKEAKTENGFCSQACSASYLCSERNIDVIRSYNANPDPRLFDSLMDKLNSKLVSVITSSKEQRLTVEGKEPNKTVNIKELVSLNANDAVPVNSGI